MASQSASPSPLPAAKASRFERKRERILDAASILIEKRGVKGMTFAEVAQMVELNTTSITYYFRLKDQLAAAVFEHTLERLEAMAIEAGAEADPHARVARYLELHFDLRARVIRGEERGLATLSDIRSLEDGARAPLEKHYQAIFRRIRAFFGDVDTDGRKALLTARAHMLTEVTFWLPAWIRRYSISDFARVRTKLFELLSHGIAPAGANWAPAILSRLEEASDERPESGRGAFLRAATRLINELGYRGASVDRIVAELNVTKGSFYHHLDAKDDLVLECFRRSYRRVSCAQHLADEAGDTHGQRLSAAIATLLDVQFRGTWPLLRTTALQALPTDVRADVVERSNRMALRFAGTLVDGIGEGSIRPVDPMIASQIIMATLNAAYDLRHWAQRLPRDTATILYASTLATGLFDDVAISIPDI